MLLQDFTTKAKDALGLRRGAKLHDRGQWVGEFKLTKWEFDESIREEAELDLKAGLSVKQIKFKYGENAVLVSDEVIGKNLLTNYGINTIIWPLVAGGAGTAMSNANARIGVGDSSTAAAASQTDLQAATNKTYVAMDATYPTYGTSQQLVLRATFGSGSANYAWNEFISDNGTVAHAMNRLVSTQGTKTAGQSWQVTLTITLS